MFINDAGVRLHLEDGVDSNGRQVQNNSVISGNSLAYRHGLACYTSVDDTNTVGEWIFPDGREVSAETIDSQQVLFAHRQLGRVTLQIKTGQQFTRQFEGVYTCLIPDETGTTRTLLAGIYSASTYDSLGIAS